MKENKKNPNGRKTVELTGSAAVEAYIAGFPPRVQEILRRLREIILAEAPGADEKISYGMPAYSQAGPLVYFAAYARHVGFYPTSSGIAAFEEQLKGYPHAKGSVRLAIDRPVPYELIAEIVRFRAAENSETAKKSPAV